MNLLCVATLPIVAAFLLRGHTPAHAQGAVTFNNPWINNGVDGFSLDYYDQFSFRVSPGPPQLHSEVVRVGATGPAGYPHNGTPYTAFLNTLEIPQAVVFARTNAARFGDHSFTRGAPFGLISVDLADPVAPSPSLLAITFNGFLADNTMVSQTFTIGGGGSTRFETVHFSPAFASGLVRVEIPSPRWAMDNLVWVVPEPASAGVFVLGLTVVAVMQGRRRR